MADVQNGAGSDGRASNGTVAESTSPPAQDKAQNGGDTADKQPKQGMKPLTKLVLFAVGAVALVFAVIWGLRYWNFSKSHVSTDDAYVTGNLINVSPVIGGTLSALYVDEGDVVKQGQLIGRLSDSGEIAALRQAQAAYQAALSQISQARSSLAYQQLATSASIKRAQAGIQVQSAKTSGAQKQVTLTSDTVQNQVRQAQAQVIAAQAQADQAQSQVATAIAAQENYRQGIQTAQSAANASTARIAAAQAEAARTAKDAERYRRLLAEDAVSQQQYDLAVAQAQSAQSQLSATREEAAQGRSQVAQAQSSVVQAAAQVQAARKAAAAFTEQVAVARAGLRLAMASQTQVGIQQSNVLTNVGQSEQARADLSDAQAGQEQVTLRRKQIAMAEAQAQQAQQVLANAQIMEGDTYVYAPYAGTIVRKIATAGASLSPGQAIVTLTEGDNVWVEANFKETQLENVRPGQYTEVVADSFPNLIFKGQVQSINEATGASTSLLPPDNATGNFTKVVQRIPVKILLLPAGDKEDKKFARAADIHNLRQGMSVVATIETDKGGQTNRGAGQARPRGEVTSSGTASSMGASPGGNVTGPGAAVMDSSAGRRQGPVISASGAEQQGDTAGMSGGANRNVQSARNTNDGNSITIPNPGAGPMSQRGGAMSPSMSPNVTNPGVGATPQTGGRPIGGMTGSGANGNAPSSGTSNGAQSGTGGAGASGTVGGAGAIPGGGGGANNNLPTPVVPTPQPPAGGGLPGLSPAAPIAPGVGAGR